MLKNYIITAYRNVMRNKGFAFINIAGLAIGIVCTALIFLWVEDEFSFNKHFANRNDLYMVKDSQAYDGRTYVFDATPGPLAKVMKEDIPGFAATARSSWETKLLFDVNNKKAYASGHYVDSDFLRMFGLDFINGNAATAFKEQYSVVLSQKTAAKFFGSEPAIGKIIKVDNQINAVVTGVVKDLSENSTIRFEWLASFKLFEAQNEWLTKWGSNSILTYAQLQPNANLDAINKKLFNIVSTKAEGVNTHMSLYPMDRWHLYNNFDENGHEIEGRIKYVRIFIIIAWIILIIACINFMNLATARSEKRAREVGIRKTLGSAKQSLVLQFISESLLMSLIAGVMATLILALVLPPFNLLVQKNMALDLLAPAHFISLLLIILVCGLVAGSYPAFYLSSFQPVAVLKGLRISGSSGAAFIRRGLVVLQFSISVILIICTIVIYRQISHVKHRDIGYQKEGLIFSSVQGSMGTNFSAIKHELQASGLVENACLSSNIILELGSNTGDFSWPGKDPSKQVLITVESVSPEYVSTLGVTLKEGRDFYPNSKADSNNVIINERLAKLIGIKDIVGTKLSRDGSSGYTVVGVIKDFIYNSMYAPAQPTILFSNPENTIVMTIRFKKGIDLAKGVQTAEAVIKKQNPAYPFEYHFIDERFDRLFKTEQLVGKLSGLFAVLAIFISCLGLFGLAAYMAERRAREISIRKILGATTRLIMVLMSRDFLVLVLVACLVAFPLSWWFMHSWLREYEYRVEISWWIFAMAGLSALLISLITLSFQAIKAALANPVKNLRADS